MPGRIADRMAAWGLNSEERRAFLKKIPGIAGTALLATVLPGCARSHGESSRRSFTFAASFKGDLYYPAIIAEQEGFYRDEGLKVSIAYGFGGGDSLRLVAAGRLPMNCAEAGESVALADHKGAHVSLICTYMVGESNSLVGQPGIRSYKDLPRDILLGVSNPYASSTISALLLLKKGGVDLQRVTTVSVGSSIGRYAAVLARKVHVAAVILPFAVRAPLDGLHILGSAKDLAYPTVFISHSVNDAWVNRSKENFDLAVRNTTATLRGLHWGFANKNKMIQWVEEVEKVPAQVAPHYYEVAFEGNRPIFSSDGKLLAKAWQNTFTELQFAQELEAPFPGIGKLQRDDIYEAAVKRLREVYRIELPPSAAESV
ncbi:MAG TPA: ABC transporter substrate-binding protein [Candidatus Dormibacteraeota bacterium]|nr:ABC transporter substrate-binding protein [Candidatus Dormibacteraeota bacterium]